LNLVNGTCHVNYFLVSSNHKHPTASTTMTMRGLESQDADASSGLSPRYFCFFLSFFIPYYRVGTRTTRMAATTVAPICLGTVTAAATSSSATSVTAAHTAAVGATEHK
jgi:hypothetical protein